MPTPGVASVQAVLSASCHPHPCALYQESHSSDPTAVHRPTPEPRLASPPPSRPHFPALLRGGVLGLLPIMLPNPPISFLSAGFKIWKLHMRFSSTVIIAPALSNSPQ